MVQDMPPKLSSKISRPVPHFLPNTVHKMTQNVLTYVIFTTMTGFLKDDMVPNFQHGLKLFNNKDLPQALRSSCLTLVAQQEIFRNPLHSSDIQYPKKKCYMD
jgi:hypothetical protein